MYIRSSLYKEYGYQESLDSLLMPFKKVASASQARKPETLCSVSSTPDTEQLQVSEQALNVDFNWFKRRFKSFSLPSLLTILSSPMPFPAFCIFQYRRSFYFTRHWLHLPPIQDIPVSFSQSCRMTVAVALHIIFCLFFLLVLPEKSLVQAEGKTGGIYIDPSCNSSSSPCLFLFIFNFFYSYVYIYMISHQSAASKCSASNGMLI